MPIEIDRRAGLGRSAFRAEYASRSMPVILTDAIDHWPARGKWDLDYFADRFADKQVTFDRQSWRVGDIVERLKRTDGGPATPYLKEVTLDRQFPELWPDVAPLEAAAGNRLRSRLLPPAMRLDRGFTAVFVGARGSGFRKLHWDYSYLHVFISQVHGPKDFIVFRPQDTPNLYPNPDYPNLSLIPDPYHVDPAAFPAFANADATRLTLREGETLFLPAGWWHATHIEEPSISIAESTLDAYNWTVRKDWYLDAYARDGVPAAKRRMLDLYLRAANAAL